MISDDATVQVCAAVIFGVLILVSVVQSAWSRMDKAGYMTGAFVLFSNGLVVGPFAIAAVLAILGLNEYANFVLIVGFLLLIVYLYFVSQFVRT